MAAVDPFWGVLTVPEYKHGSRARAAFFASGEQQVQAMLAVADKLDRPNARDSALDFGCGLGRLTRALAGRFTLVHGVDVSAALIEHAVRLNADLSNCEFRVLDRHELGIFPDGSFDLVSSLLVLQHQARRKKIRAYIGEFVRVLRPGGLAVFQIPTYIPPRNRIQPRRRLYSALRTVGVPASVLYGRLGLDPIRMLHMPRREVLEAVERAGGRLLTAIDDDLAGSFPSATYYVTRSTP